ncbi:MAG: Wzz/FepE/Etk N-terminal domain-containing protein [Bacteroidota bacterium]
MDEAQKKTDFLDYLSVLVKWRRFIIINVLVVTVIAVIASLTLPKWYRATASVLPPKEPDMLGSLGAASSVLRGLSGARALRGLGQSQGAYNYFAILKSRTAMEAVVRRFDLFQVYEVSDTSMEKAVRALAGNTAFETGDDDNITIEVLDKDPQRAADMANYFVEVLNDISLKLGTQEAKNNREFIEKRLEKSREDLHQTEEALQEYQEKSGIIVTIDPSTPGVSAIAELYGMKAKKEIELAILKRTVTADNPLVKQAELELRELDRKLSTFPGVGIESLRLYRDLAIQQKIIEFLVPLHEQAKVDEQKDVPVLLVLDKAIAPERKVKPQRSLIVFLAGTLSLFFFVLLAFLLHGLARRGGELRPLESKLHGYAWWIAARYKVQLA